MRPPGEQLHLYQCQPGAAVQHPVAQAGLLNALFPCGDNVCQACFLVTCQQVGEGALPLRRGAAQHRQIVLFEGALPYLAGQVAGGVGAAGKHHQAGHRGVQPVDGADAFGVQLLPQKGGHAARLVGGEDAGGLHRHHDAPVLKENIHVEIPLILNLNICYIYHYISTFRRLQEKLLTRVV